MSKVKYNGKNFKIEPNGRMTTSHKSDYDIFDEEGYRLVTNFNPVKFNYYQRAIKVSGAGDNLKIVSNFAPYAVDNRTLRSDDLYYSLWVRLEYKEDGSDKTVFEPDVLIVCDKDKIKGLKTINGAPDFVVEVLSNSNRKYEMYDKLHKYRTCGVREYWVVDYDHNKIIKHYFENDGEIMIYSMEDKVPVDIYGGKLEIDFKEIKEYIDGIIN